MITVTQLPASDLAPSNVEEFPTFYACRPEWMTAEQQEQFKVNHPDLVEEYADCWTPETDD